MKKCNYCEKLNADNATVCGYCGADLQYASSKQSSENNTQNTQQHHVEEYYMRNNPFDSDPMGKSRGVAAILAILIGGVGVHYFYLGKVVAGLICLLLTIVTCGFWSLITFIQGIVFFCMDNYTFDRKFVYSNTTFPVF